MGTKRPDELYTALEGLEARRQQRRDAVSVFEGYCFVLGEAFFPAMKSGFVVGAMVGFELYFKPFEQVVCEAKVHPGWIWRCRWWPCCLGLVEFVLELVEAPTSWCDRGGPH